MQSFEIRFVSNGANEVWAKQELKSFFETREKRKLELDIQILLNKKKKPDNVRFIEYSF